MNFPPPSIQLFFASALGAYGGLLCEIPKLYFGLVVFLSLIVLMVTRNYVVRVLSILLLTSMITSVMARVQIERQRVRIAALPLTESNFEGIFHNGSLSLNDRLRGDFSNLVLTLSGAASQVQIGEGDRIRVRGTVHLLPHALSPGEFDPYWYGLARGIDGRLSVNKPVNVTVIKRDADKSIWSSWRVALRHRLLELTTPREAAVLLALILGDVRLFDDEQTQIYRNVGAGHLLAVSGLQVSLLALVFFRFFQYLLLLVPQIGRRSRTRPIAIMLSLMAIWGFTALCGAPPSAVRAAMMATVMLSGMLLSKKVTVADAFGVAGLSTVLYWPISVVDPSFLLSYAAVLGLMLGSKNMLTASIGAGLMTLPISAHLFGSLSLGGLLVNIVLIPVAVILQTPAIFIAVIGACMKSSFLIDIAAGMAGFLEAICESMGQWFGSVVTVTAPSGSATVILTLSVLCFIHAMVSQRRVVCLVCGACLAIFAIAPNYIHPNGVRITLLPVGQGDSTVFELPSGHVLLVDGGGNYDASFDPGRRVIEPFLRRRSIKRIDIMVVTHPHLDHLLGLLQVANEFEIGEIWHSGFSNQDPLLAQLLDVADKRHIIVKQGHEIWGTHLFGGVNVDVLAPRPPSGDIFTTWSTNNNSLVFRMSYQQDSALWPGDAEQEAEVELLAHHANLKSTIVKAGHHGSRTSSSPEWVSATNPEHVIFCTQQGNQWGFPHPEIVARWKQQGTKTWDTGTNGELTFWMTGNGVKAESFR